METTEKGGDSAEEASLRNLATEESPSSHPSTGPDGWVPDFLPTLDA